MAYLFDSDAISEVLRKRPSPSYIRWLESVPLADQFTSAVVVGELFKGAFRSPARDRHLANIENRVLPEVTVLPYDVFVARVYGEINAELQAAGKPLDDPDLQIAATAIHYGLQLVTGNVRHFERIGGLRIHRATSPPRSHPEGEPCEPEGSGRWKGPPSQILPLVPRVRMTAGAPQAGLTKWN